VQEICKKLHLTCVDEMSMKMSPFLCAGIVQEIVPYTVSGNVKEMLKFPLVGNIHEM